MTHSECVYMRYFIGYPLDSLQIGEKFFEFKDALNFSKGKNMYLLF
jgi:hypothetical protein